MMLAIPRSNVIPKLASDSESLTLSESCVKSDIANIIRKIYSPRPLMSGVAADSPVESRDIEENRVRISRPKEEEEKRFGFHFESVTGHFAKTIVDSSTTSGSVSVPVVRYKPKRVRTVCDCCKRKIPHHVDETRAKRAYRDCRICKTNDGSVLGNSSGFVGVSKEVDPTVHNSRMKASNYEIIRINSGTIPNGHNSKMKVSNYEVRINPAANFTMHDQIQLSSMNLERKPSLIDIYNRVSGNVPWSENNKNELDGSSVSNLQVVPNTASNKRINTSPRLSIHNLEEGKVKSPSFFQRIMSNLVGKNLQSNSLEEGTRPSKIKKTDNPKHAEKKSSKTSIKQEKPAKPQRNKHSLTNFGNYYSVAVSGDPKGRLLPEEEMRKSTDIKEQNKESSPILTSEKDDLEQVTVDQSPEKKKSEHKIEKEPAENLEWRQDFTTPLEEIEITSSTKELKDEVIEKDHERQHKKYQVAYKSLTIEVDTDWAYEFWAGFFGTCHSVISFFTAFFLHLLTFVLQSLIQPIFCGTVRISSEHFFNPCLSTAYESVVQPLCKVIERLAGSLRDICLPVAQCFGVFCKEVSYICKACRVVEIHKNYNFNEGIRNP